MQAECLKEGNRNGLFPPTSRRYPGAFFYWKLRKIDFCGRAAADHLMAGTSL